VKSKSVLGLRKRRILIVDDHPLLRNGLAKIIDQQADLAVCGEAEDFRGALAAVAAAKPDAAIVDLTLEDGNGLDLIHDIHVRRPELPLLVLSMHHENLYAERAVRAGARGYVMKHEPVARVVAALRKVLAGHLALSDEIVSRLVGPPPRRKKTCSGSPADRLSGRELDVFRLLGSGFGTRQIAAKLRVAPSTIDTHRAGIKLKLKLRSATELVAAATRFLAEETRA